MFDNGMPTPGGMLRAEKHTSTANGTLCGRKQGVAVIKDSTSGYHPRVCGLVAIDETDPRHGSKQCARSQPTSTSSYDSRQYYEASHGEHKQSNDCSDPVFTDDGSQWVCVSRPPLHEVSKGLVQRETLARLYIVSMFTGFAVLGIVGGADSEEYVFVSLSIFTGFFVPVVVIHGTMMMHRMWALIPMIMYVIYAPVGISLSIIHKTHAFISFSLILVGIFFLMAGVCGIGRAVSGFFLILFVWMCFGVGVETSDRGDIIALVIRPGLQIIYVCVAGVFSVLSLPGYGGGRDKLYTAQNRNTC